MAKPFPRIKYTHLPNLENSELPHLVPDKIQEGHKMAVCVYYGSSCMQMTWL